VALTTFPADGDVERFAATLVEEKLAACINVLPPMRSIYAWRGTIERADERQLLIKTRTAAVPQLERRIKELHPYDVPEFLVIPILDGSPDYLSWLAAESS
jgi:periplasmic divalent cation tolerance protein